MVNGLVNNIIVSFQNVIHRGFIFTKGTRCLGRKFIEIYRKTNRYAFYRHIPKDRCQNGKVWQMNQSRKNTKNAHGKASCLEKRSYRTPRDREDHGLLYPGSRDYMTSEHVRLVMVIDRHYSAPS